jgi:hypothetical protein
LSDLGEETGWHRNSGQAPQSLKDISFQSGSDSVTRGPLYAVTNLREEENDREIGQTRREASSRAIASPNAETGAEVVWATLASDPSAVVGFTNCTLVFPETLAAQVQA